MLSGESAIGPFGEKALSVLRMTSSRMELWSREENRQNILLENNLGASLPDQIAEQICNSAAGMGMFFMVLTTSRCHFQQLTP